MARRRLSIRADVRLRAYDLLERALEEGVAYGWRRAHKHEDNPSAEHIQEQIHNACLNALCEIMNFGDETEE